MVPIRFSSKFEMEAKKNERKIITAKTKILTLKAQKTVSCIVQHKKIQCYCHALFKNHNNLTIKRHFNKIHICKFKTRGRYDSNLNKTMHYIHTYNVK